MSDVGIQGDEAPAFAHLVQRALNAALTPELVAEKVAEHVERLVESTIADAMAKWSSTGKDIKEAVEASLRVSRLNLPSYGHIVAQMLEAQIQARVADVVAAKLQADMESLLTLAPKRVKLSDLVARLLEGDGLGDEPTAVGMQIEWGDYLSCWLRLHPSEVPQRASDCRIRLLISLAKKPDDCEPGETPEGTITLGHVDGSELKRDIRFGFGTDVGERRSFGWWFGFEQKILSMYAVGTVIELDEDACVLSKYDW